jgi:hypothetical protein
MWQAVKMSDPEQPTNETPSMPAPPGGEPAAPTAPSAPAPSRKGVWIAVALLVAVVGGAGIYLAGSGGPATYSEHGVTFDYPGGWEPLGPATFGAETGETEWTESFFSESGYSGVIVTEYALLQEVSSVSQEALRAELQGLLDSSLQQTGGEIVDDLSPVTVDGLDGFRVVFTVVVDGTEAESDLVMVFQGKRQFNILCQYEPDTETEVLSGCEQVRDTFAVTG